MKKINVKQIGAIACFLVTLIFSATSVLAADANVDSEHEMTQPQRDILMALGVNESEIDSITSREIGQVLAHGQIKNYKYISKYLPTSDELQLDYNNYQKSISMIIDKFPEAALNNEDVERMLKFSMMTPESFISLPKTLVSIYKQQSQITTRAAFNSTMYTYFTRGTNQLKYYKYSSCDIHRDTLSTNYARNATTAHYNEMNDNVAFSRAICEYLFGRSININSTSQYSYGLWGDWYPSVGGAHQGIDFTIAENTPVYTVARGRVVVKKNELGGTTLVIENTNLELRYIYMHLKDVPVQVNSYIYEGTYIGNQGRYVSGSTSNSHVHFEVTDNLTQTSGSPNKTNSIYSANPYFAGLYYIAN